MRSFTAASLALGLLAAPASSEDSFLGVAFGARALGLGGAYSAVADDPQAVLWNPAGIAQLTQISLSGSQNHLSFTENVYAITLNVPLRRWGTVAFSVQQLNVDNIGLTRPVLDANGNPVLDPTTNLPLVEITGFGQETDGTFLVGYAFAPTSWWLVGGAGKFLLGNAGGVLGTGGGANVGTLVKLSRAWRFGVVAEDVGDTTVRWKDQTRTILRARGRAGVAWNPRPAWLFSVEARSPLSHLKLVSAVGAEWAFTEVLVFRAGADDLRLTGGVGFTMPLGEGGAYASADYAFVTGSQFEDRNRLSLTVGF